MSLRLAGSFGPPPHAVDTNGHEAVRRKVAQKWRVPIGNGGDARSEDDRRVQEPVRAQRVGSEDRVVVVRPHVGLHRGLERTGLGVIGDRRQRCAWGSARAPVYGNATLSDDAAIGARIGRESAVAPT